MWACRRHSVTTGQSCNPNGSMQEFVLNTIRVTLQLLPHSWLGSEPHRPCHTPEMQVADPCQATSSTYQKQDLHTLMMGPQGLPARHMPGAPTHARLGASHTPDWALAPPACRTPGGEAAPFLLAPLHSPCLHTAAGGSLAADSSPSTVARWCRVPDTLDLGRAPVAVELAGCCHSHRPAAGRVGFV